MRLDGVYWSGGSSLLKAISLYQYSSRYLELLSATCYQMSGINVARSS
jgi:hypothetical protein